jgi:hypothetical protein
MFHLKNRLITTLFLLLFSIIGYSQIQEGIITVDVSPEIKSVIAKKVAYNKTQPKIHGYRIQLFYGSESGAISNRSKFTSLFPTTPTYIEYDSPDWKVRVGNYKTRLEADKSLVEIKATFGNAIVLKQKIRI